MKECYFISRVEGFYIILLKDLIYYHRCEEACEAFESCMGDLGDVESFMNRLQVSNFL